MSRISQDGEETKRKRNAIAIRRKILIASRELFAEIGYQAATISRIRDNADVSIATFYKYFDSKQSVLLALLEDERESYEDSIKSALDGAVDEPVVYMTSVVEALLDPPANPRLKMLWRETIAATIVLAADPVAGPQISSDHAFYLRQLECAFDRLEDSSLLKAGTPVKTLLTVVECIVAYGFQNYVCDRYPSREEFLTHIRQQLTDILQPWLLSVESSRHDDKNRRGRARNS